MRRRVESELCMGTTVTLHLVSSEPESVVNKRMESAFAVFRNVEQQCNRFDVTSPLRELSDTVGTPVQVPDILFHTIKFSLAMAALTDGLFTPTIGHAMERYGFNKNYITGESINSSFVADPDASYRDISLDEERKTVTLHRPLLLDVNAVAKGFAVDLAARELYDVPGFTIDAGGDLFLHGSTEDGDPWSVDIVHPMHPAKAICSLQHVQDAAVCTSGSYERVSPVDQNTHHILNSKQPHGETQNGTVSCTVIAPYAMMADAFSTAAFLYGGVNGVKLLEDNGLEGLIIASDERRYVTNKMEDFIDAFYE